MKGPFYATIKMNSGEEVLAEVLAMDEDGFEYFMLYNPIVMDEQFVYDESGNPTTRLTAHKWLKFSQDDMDIVYKDKIITISELDKFGVSHYQKYLLVAKIKSPVRREMQTKEHTGYLGKVDDQRDYLERLFKQS